METKKIFFLGTLALFFGVVALVIFFSVDKPIDSQKGKPTIANITKDIETYTTFGSAEEFTNYLAMADAGYSGISNLSFVREEAFALDASAPVGESPQDSKRVSTTNVQVAGIDEPDILKTNGESFFYSPEQEQYYFSDVEYSVPQKQNSAITSIIQAIPPENTAVQSTIAQAGELLLSNDTLLVISSERVVGYDVSDPTQPKQLWEKTFDQSQYVTARLFNDKLYLVTTTWPDMNAPCPFVVMRSTELGEDSIPCDRIYHPTTPQSAEGVTSVLALNPTSGSTDHTFSTIAQGYQSIVSMSDNALYIADPREGDHVAFVVNFLTQTEEAKNIFDDELIADVERMNEYDISPQAKNIELQNLINESVARLDDPEKKRIEYEKALEEYYGAHRRELEYTVITKISTADLSLQAQGSVPGTPLNQFSLDEHNNHLRIATTIGEDRIYSDESVNDVFVLDDSLSVVGHLEDLGKEERIYAMRFVGDVGYMVTFRETDPFYVIDLKDPTQPKKVGELKIPGYSSYLHPLTDTLVLGVGKEDFATKIALFDVSNPAEPKELQKEILGQYTWSEVENNHHAFLQDSEKEIFFFPLQDAGMIYSYANNQLKEVHAIEDISAMRAAYIDDYFYVFGRSMMHVYDQRTWEKILEKKI